MKIFRTLLFFLFACSLCTALAVTYRVDQAGGPDGLAAAVAEAFTAWQGLAPTLEVSESEDATTLFRYGDTALLGDDTLSLTVQRQGAERTLDVLVTPLAGPLENNALLHETGLLLDLGTSDTGVMNPALPETPLSLGDPEIAALGTLTAVKEDVNRDGVVDFYDLVELAKNFGQPGINAPADINDDGLVDSQDVQLLRAAYTFAPPSSTGPSQAAETFGESGGDGTFGDGLEPPPGETGGGETGGSETGGSETGGAATAEENVTPAAGGETGGGESGGSGSGGGESGGSAP